MSLFAANQGYLDDIELDKIGDFEAALLSYARSNYGDLVKKINETGDWNDEIEDSFKKIVEEFKADHAW